MARYEIRVLDPALAWVDVADQYKSLTWKRRWQKPGEFHLVINKNTKAAANIKKGGVLYIRRDGKHEAAGYIRRVARRIEEGGKITEDLEVSGNTLDGILARRICLPPSGSAYDERTGPAETVMHGYVNANAVSPDDPARKIPNLALGTDQGRGATITERMRYNPLPEALLFCALAGGNLGWEITLEGKQFIFNVLAGTDRSSAQSTVPPIIFSPDFENIRLMAWEQSDIGIFNSAYVAGQGEGAARTIVTLPATETVQDTDDAQADFLEYTLADLVATAAPDVFQDYEDDTAQYWSGNIQVSTDQAYSGAKSLKIMDSASGGPAYSYDGEIVGDYATFDFKIYVPAGVIRRLYCTNGVFRFVHGNLYCYDGSSYVTFATYNEGAWNHIKITNGPPGSKYYTVEVNGATYQPVSRYDNGYPMESMFFPDSDVLYIDDFKHYGGYEAGDLELEQNPNVIPDGDFSTKTLQAPYSSAIRGSLSFVDDPTAPTSDVALKHEATGTDSYTVPYAGTNAALAPAAEGETWTGSVFCKVEQDDTQVQIYVFALDENYNYIDLAHYKESHNIADGWFRISATLTMPAGTKYVACRVDNDGGAGAVVYWNGWLLEKADQAGPFRETYMPTGTGQTPGLALADAGKYTTSSITWTSTEPAGTSILVEAKLDNQSDWQECTSGQEIPVFEHGQDLESRTLYIRVTEETTDTTTTPQLHSLTVEVNGCEHVGLGRIEQFVDARDLDTTDKLEQRGQAKLAEQDEKEKLEAEILRPVNPATFFRYRDDWDLGDIVTLRNLDWGLTLHKRIMEVKVVLEPGKEEEIAVVFGAPWATLGDQVKSGLQQMGPALRK